MAYKLEAGLEALGAVSFVTGVGLELAHMTSEGVIMLGVGSGLFVLGAITEHVRSRQDQRHSEPLAK